MQSDYTLLVTTGIAGALSLLAIELIPGVRLWRKSITATLLSLITLLWAALPTSGTWPLSVWSPSTVLGGVLLWDLTPPLWGLGLIMALALSGGAWIEAADSRAALPLSGPITLAALLAAWHALAGGSLLTTLALWSVFDVLWGAAGMLSGNDGERMTFGLFAHGSASLCLWAALLLLSREGGGTLWSFLWPTPPVVILLVVAAFLRIGLYPFQVVFPRRLRAAGPMALVALLGPVMGFALLYRLLLLPAADSLPGGVTAMGLLSLLWGGARALMGRGKSALLWANYGLIGGIAGAIAMTGLSSLLPAALGTWLLGFSLMLELRQREVHAIFWSWPGWMALLFLMGVPPSPLGTLFRAALSGTIWIWQLTMVVGWAFVATVLLRWVRSPWERTRLAQVSVTVTPLRAWQHTGLLAGFMLSLGGMFWASLSVPAITFAWSGFFPWLVMLILTLGLSWGISLERSRGLTLREGGHIAEWLRTGVGLMEILDLQWLHRALLRGMGHLLSVLRVFFEVVEGSSALLWSLLILLVLYLVTVSR